MDPEFPPYVLSQVKTPSVTVHVKARIDQKGDPAVSEVYGGSPFLHTAVRNAFQQWKFSPAFDDAQPRCVDTDIPIVINLNK